MQCVMLYYSHCANLSGFCSENFTLSYIILLYYNVHTVSSDMFSLSAVQDLGARYNHIVLYIIVIYYIYFFSFAFAIMQLPVGRGGGK